MFGALVLSARAAVRLGAGKTYACHIANVNQPVVDWQTPEIMWHPANTELLTSECIAVGPGLGMDDSAAAVLLSVLKSPANVVLDADALNLVASHADIAALLKKRKGQAILTPHPAEAARLLAQATATAAEVNKDRIGVAQHLAQTFSAIVVLKGAGTIICDENGNWAINASGNPGLSQAGAGDVLTGMIAALLAQTNDALFAARAGVWLHGAGADILAKRGGEVGLDLGRIAPTAARLVSGGGGIAR